VTLYNAEEYPDVEKLRDKFRFKYVFLPVPEIGDFRVDVNEEHKAELVKQFESFYEKQVIRSYERCVGQATRLLE
jgi:hypothetical protein